MVSSVKLDYLAIAAHPDDIEITCGGLMIKMADLGRKTGAVDLTCGEMGTFGHAGQRIEEATRAAELMGMSYRTQLDIPDSAVELNQPNRLKVAQVIRDTAPEVVVLPHWQQRHPDHRICSQLGYDACFLAGLKNAPLDGDPHRPSRILYASYYRNTDISFLVNVSEQFVRKLRAVSTYTSQFGDSTEELDRIVSLTEGGTVAVISSESVQENEIFHPGTSIYEYMYIRSRHMALLGNVMFAEGYTVKENLTLDDPDVLLNRSI